MRNSAVQKTTLKSSDHETRVEFERNSFTLFRFKTIANQFTRLAGDCRLNRSQPILTVKGRFIASMVARAIYTTQLHSSRKHCESREDHLRTAYT
ncbi:hypothetical protein L596_022020 [Steinernema carpocapsae]|uniref:Uncharacterized protein n=1 Tax=Steinernema carpocapsae TaxID=34508 RepID=A0A4U5MLB6_STECR|nr:hypothetical protein L596_022020 [Steinernema carpocapsae]